MSLEILTIVAKTCRQKHTDIKKFRWELDASRIDVGRPSKAPLYLILGAQPFSCFYYSSKVIHAQEGEHDRGSILDNAFLVEMHASASAVPLQTLLPVVPGGARIKKPRITQSIF